MIQKTLKAYQEDLGIKCSKLACLDEKNCISFS